MSRLRAPGALLAAIVAVALARGDGSLAVAATPACASTVGPSLPPPAQVPAGLPGFHAAWYGQSGYPTLCPGQRAAAVVAYYNSGSLGWVLGRRDETAYLGTWDPVPGQDQASVLGGDGTRGSPDTGWPGSQRVAVQPAPYVGPGQVAWFRFTIQAPRTPGRYTLALRPLIEGVTWMEDFGVFWLVTVLNADGSPPEAPPALPARWPHATLQLGMADGPGGAAALRATAPFGLRYQYLSGGVNTGRGWTTWNPDGSFVTAYVEESRAQGVTPVFTYYMIRGSAPGSALGEAAGDVANLADPATMSAYFRDLRLFFQRAGAFPTEAVVLHVEPDLWGFVQQRFGDDAARAPAAVSATGLAELAGLPDSVAGFAAAILRLRDALAPNVVVGYHLSTWGTGVDPLLAKPSDAEIDTLAARSAAFYRSLGARSDLAFAELGDRDAAFKEFQQHDRGASWWAPADFARNARYLSAFSRATRLPLVEWQVPLGNTKMRAVDNTWGHYQDNKVETFLDEPTRGQLLAYLQAGVIAFLFGRGAEGTTCACDAVGDGVRDPPPIDGNVRPSLGPDDDGGYFRERAAAYYARGAPQLR